jgi:Flp pilus assembly protein TadG
MVEFALAASVFLLLLFGILEFGRALYTYHAVSNAARLGSRWAIVRGSSCTAPLDHCNAQSSDVQTYVRSQIVALMDPTQVNVTVTWPGNGGSCAAGSNAPGCPVQVAVAYPFTFALSFVGSQLNITSTSEMAISQ